MLLTPERAVEQLEAGQFFCDFPLTAQPTNVVRLCHLKLGRTSGRTFRGRFVNEKSGQKILLEQCENPVIKSVNIGKQ